MGENSLYPQARLVPFQGVRNFRDMGGYETTDGRKVKYGLFFRSAELKGMTEEDRALFETLGIKYIFDYRTDKEEAMKPNPLFDGVVNERVPVIEESKTAVRSIDDMTTDEIAEYLHNKDLYNLYQQMIFNNPAYKRLMEIIQEPDNLAIVHHCAAGKDRTGIGAAFILLALGVPEETVMADYLLTNEYLTSLVDKVKARMGVHVTSEDLAKLGVKKEYLAGVFKAIKEEYGDFDSFFSAEFGLTTSKRAQLQNDYLD